MKFPRLDPFYRAALILFIAAIVLVAVALVTERHDLTSAALVIAGIVCLLTGIFMATLSGNDPLDTRYVSLLPVQGSISVTRICSDLGILGNACFIPKGKDGRPATMQYLPVSIYSGGPLPADSFVTGPSDAGVLVEPSCGPLLREITAHERLVIPTEMPALHALVREIGEEVLEVSSRVSSSDNDDVLTVTMLNYRLVTGCRAVHQESPRCCVMNPCPVCSLVACVFAEGTGSVVMMERCSPDAKGDTLTMSFSMMAK